MRYGLGVWPGEEGAQCPGLPQWLDNCSNGAREHRYRPQLVEGTPYVLWLAVFWWGSSQTSSIGAQSSMSRELELVLEYQVAMFDQNLGLERCSWSSADCRNCHTILLDKIWWAFETQLESMSYTCTRTDRYENWPWYTQSNSGDQLRIIHRSRYYICICVLYTYVCIQYTYTYV